MMPATFAYRSKAAGLAIPGVSITAVNTLIYIAWNTLPLLENGAKRKQAPARVSQLILAKFVVLNKEDKRYEATKDGLSYIEALMRKNVI